LRLLLGIGRASDALLEVGEQIEEVLPNVPIKLILLDILAHDLANVFAHQPSAAWGRRLMGLLCGLRTTKAAEHQDTNDRRSQRRSEAGEAPGQEHLPSLGRLRRTTSRPSVERRQVEERNRREESPDQATPSNGSPHRMMLWHTVTESGPHNVHGHQPPAPLGEPVGCCVLLGGFRFASD
jgi:hypothetical protein